MTARFNGKCAGCGTPTLKDSTIEYEYETKRAFHPECAPGVGNPRESTDDPYGGSAGESVVELAERLGFRKFA